MEGRTLLKIETTENGVCIRTISRDYRSPVRFYIPKEKLEELEETQYIITFDVCSFLKMYLYKTAEGKQAIEWSFTG